MLPLSKISTRINGMIRQDSVALSSHKWYNPKNSGIYRLPDLSQIYTRGGIGSVRKINII